MRNKLGYSIIGGVLLLVVFLLAPLASSTPNFTAKWQICSYLNFTDPVDCDQWWYDSNWTALGTSYIVLKDFNMTFIIQNLSKEFSAHLADNMSSDFWRKNLTYNQTEIKEMMGSMNKSILIRINNTNHSLTKIISNLEKKQKENYDYLYRSLQSKGDLGVGWKLMIILSFFIGLGIAGFIFYEYKKSQEE